MFSFCNIAPKMVWGVFFFIQQGHNKLVLSHSKDFYIYVYAFSRRFYPKRLKVHSGYNFCFISMCVPWELNPQPFARLTQCSTTEQQEHRNFSNKCCP